MCLSKIVFWSGVLLLFTPFKLLGWLLILGWLAFHAYLFFGVSADKPRASVIDKSTDSISGLKPFGRFRDLDYYSLKGRTAFHRALISTRENYPTGSYVLAEKDELGRIVGGYVTFTGEEADERVRDVSYGVYSRNDETRKNAFVPGFDLVKRKWVEVKGKNMPLYHRTHLVPFRYCLNDGEFADVMFAGSARLNMGLKASEGYFPTDEDHAKNVEEILKKTMVSPNHYLDPKNSTHLSLDDFERSIGEFIHRSAEDYYHTYRYGVECYYSGNYMIPSLVAVVLVDITANKRLFAATLFNQE